MADLRGVQAKFDRACVHADAFDVLGKNLVNSHPSRLTGQMESDDWYRLRWKLQDPLPPLEQFASSSVICSTTSASPDYVVWQLIEVNGATADWRTAIPCVKNSVNWASAVGQNLPASIQHGSRRLRDFSHSTRATPGSVPRFTRWPSSTTSTTSTSTGCCQLRWSQPAGSVTRLSFPKITRRLGRAPLYWRRDRRRRRAFPGAGHATGGFQRDSG